MNIVVLAGGISNEREVSIRSGQAVATALQSRGHQVLLMDPVSGLEQIGKPDVVFLALHGKGGEDGTIQEALEKMGVPYTGSGVEASRLCFNKWNYREALIEAQLPVAKGEIVRSEDIWRSELVSKPFVLKPIEGGSTVDTYIVRDIESFAKRADITRTLFQYGDMLLENLIEGTEVTAGILGNKPLPLVEIIPPENAEFDYENKYNGKTQELCPPKNVEKELQRKVQDLALQIHELTGCRDMSRTDMIIAPSGEIFVLETNTIPGMTEQSLLPKAAAEAGMSMQDLCEKLVTMALDHSKPEIAAA